MAMGLMMLGGRLLMLMRIRDLIGGSGLACLVRRLWRGKG